MAKLAIIVNYLLAVVLITCGTASAGNEPIWLSPANASIVPPLNLEDFSADLGVWATLEGGGPGSRGHAPVAQMDSKGLLWIFGGSSENNEKYHPYGVWTYDPKTDQYRNVWRTDLTDPRNPGDLQVPAATNHPGVLEFSGGTIDNNDNIWFTTYYDNRGEFWMFNTTSWMFVRMQGLSPDTQNPSMGANPGQPGADVWPGYAEGPCMVTDSKNDIWLLTGMTVWVVSGNNVISMTDNVWHFNTTSLLWTWISGSAAPNYTAHSDTFFGGTWSPGCDIDANDRVWIYGGWGHHGARLIRDDYGSIWTYDTRSKREWEFEYGADTFTINATVVSADFNIGNIPPSCEACVFRDRLDGTMMLVPGAGRGNSSSDTTWGPRNWVWLYSKSLKQWKLVSGIDVLYPNVSYTNYREPGSELYGLYYPGRPIGKNTNGDVYLVGGKVSDYDGPCRKDIWIIPQDQCSNNLYVCDVNADCVEELIGYSCQCKEGYMGDGKTCTAVPMAPINSPVAVEPSTTSPSSQSPKGKLSNGNIVMGSFLLLFFAITIVFC